MGYKGSWSRVKNVKQYEENFDIIQWSKEEIEDEKEQIQLVDNIPRDVRVR